MLANNCLVDYSIAETCMHCWSLQLTEDFVGENMSTIDRVLRLRASKPVQLLIRVSNACSTAKY